MKRPNILLITSDQQHWDTIGAFNSEISTPNLDRLVKEGTTFPEHIVQILLAHLQGHPLSRACIQVNMVLGH